MKEFPKDKNFDCTYVLFKNGYRFIQKRCQEYQSDFFVGRFMFKKAIFMTGKEAASLFYDIEKFKRGNAIPLRVQKTLMGENSVQTLDGVAHRRRKELFISLMTYDSLQDFLSIYSDLWQRKVKTWQKKQQVILFDEMQEMLFHAACLWTGIPILNKEEMAELAKDMTLMVDGFGGAGKRYWKAKGARKRAEAWAQNVVLKVRQGFLLPPSSAALYKISWFKDANGKLLTIPVAANEFLNVVRPIVAIATYITFSAHALYKHSETRQKIIENPDYLYWFVQEVRRFYPFTPFLGARARKDFVWKNYQFKEDDLVILDVFGINHDARYWNEPEVFIPERFENREINGFDFIPQGGGDFETGHRCAGEWLTIEIMKQAVTHLAENMTYDVPEQNLDYDEARMPTRPESGFIMKNIKQASASQLYFPSSQEAPKRSKA